MKIRCQSRQVAAFSMVEIAISLGIIAFALVAIIGVLPMGMNVQKENRQQTIINHDGKYFLEAIRNGAQGLDHLTNFVEWIAIAETGPSGATLTNVYFNRNMRPAVLPDGVEVNTMVDGTWIIGLLSTPKYSGATNLYTNRVTAYVHSLSGNAMEHGTASRDLSFAYLLTSEVMPFVSYPNNHEVYRTNLVSGLTDPMANIYDVRLTFRWPVSPKGIVAQGAQRQQFRAVVSSMQTNLPTNYSLRVFAPQQFTRSW